MATFEEVLSQQLGKPASQITKNDMVEWAGSKGFDKKSIRRIKRGFNKFSKKDAEFNLTDPGEFTVSGARGSGRRTGNVKGFDLGDVVGLGRDVSTLGGALEMFATDPEATLPDATGIDAGVDIDNLTRGMVELNTSPVSTSKVKGASGQAGQQTAAQRNQQNQVSDTPKSVSIPEGIGEIAVSPDISLPPVPFQDTDITPSSPANALNDPEFRKQRQFDNLTDKFDPNTPEGKKYFENAGYMVDDQGNLLIGGTPTLDVATAVDDIFGSNVKGIPFLGPVLEDVGAVGGIGASAKSMGYTIGNNPNALKEMGRVIGSSVDDILKAGRSLRGKLKKGIKEFKDLTPIEQKIYDFLRRRIPKSRRLPQNAESLQGTMDLSGGFWRNFRSSTAAQRLPTLRLPQHAQSLQSTIIPSSTKVVGNVGFRPKVQRYGGKTKFSK